MLSRYLRKDGSYWYEADYKEIDKSEVVRLLSEFGINPDNLLIIMHQGMIEELGAISTQQRLTMVEEAVGFREYRERIFQSENDLKSMISEEGSLIQLIENANQTIEYWKQIYDRYLEKKKLLDHRGLLARELLWAQEGKLSKSMQSVREKLAMKRESLDDLSDQQEKSGAESESLHRALLDRQVELGKLYGAVVRAEKERAGGRRRRGARWRSSGPSSRPSGKTSARLKTGLDHEEAEAHPGVPGLLLTEVEERVRRGGAKEGRARQGGGFPAGRAGRRRGPHQEDDRRVHLAAGEVRGARLQDKDYRVRDTGSWSVRRRRWWRSWRRSDPTWREPARG